MCLSDLLSANDEPEFLYYMSDGVYGSFANKLLCEDSISKPLVHKVKSLVVLFDVKLNFRLCIVDLVYTHRCCVFQGVAAEEPLFSSSLWGPSEDDLDQVLDRCLLPELAVGDWLLFSSAGASSLRTAFANSDEPKPPVFYTITERDWYE